MPLTIAGLISCLVASRAGGLQVAASNSRCGDGGPSPCDNIAVGDSVAQLQKLEQNPEGEDEALPTKTYASSTYGFQDAKTILKKPIGDKRKYQYFTLGNGLQVININDRSTKTAAFAVAVTAGLFYDTPEHHGLAHLTEHSLFLGTKKWPETDGFDRYLAKNGGSSNAYTDKEVTVYYGNLNDVGFQEGLDRFADFFRSPSLDSTSIWTEVNAVVSEHAKNIQNPAWSTEGVMMAVGNPSSPLAHFHTGDAKTLQNLGAKNISDEIRAYFNSNYCPPRMRLVTFSSESVYTQLKYANTSFGDIPRLGVNGTCASEKKLFSDPSPFPDANLQKWVLVEGNSMSSTLWMLFPMQDLQPLFKSHPMSLIQYTVGWGGRNSLLLTLRDQLNLATQVSLSSEDSSAGTMVWFTVSLTQLGAQKPQAVMDAIFTFLQHSKKTLTPEVLTSLSKSSKLSWDWPDPAEADSAASGVAEAMTRMPPQDVLSSDDLMEEPNVTRAAMVIDGIKPGRMNVGLVRPDAAKVWDGDTHKNVQILAHYDVKYNVSHLNDWSSSWPHWGSEAAGDDDNMTQTYALLAERLRTIHLVNFTGNISMSVPGVIDGVPENVSLCNAWADHSTDSVTALWGAEPKSLPTGKASNELWYRKGWTSPRPTVQASFTLRKKKFAVNETVPAEDILMLQVGMHLMSDELSQRMADVGYKGFGFSVSETHTGVFVSLSGFTPNLLNLTDRLLSEMNRSLDEPDDVALARIIRGMQSDLQDTSGEAVKQAFQDQSTMLKPRVHTRQEMASALDNMSSTITFAAAKEAVHKARHGPFYGTSVIMGNYASDDAKTLHSRLLLGMGIETGLTAESVEKVTPLIKPATPIEIRKKNPRGDENHVTIVTLLAGSATVENRVLMGIASQIYGQVVFAELRTSMELGYVVGGGVSEMGTVLTVDCYVQGSKKLPDEVEGHCEHVWAVTVPEEILKLDDAAFTSHKAAFRSGLLEGPLTTDQELSHFEDPILLGGCLDLRKSMLAFLETVTDKNQLLEAWKSVVLPTASDGSVATRDKIIVKYFGGGMDVPTPAQAPQLQNATSTEDLLKMINGTIKDRVLAEKNKTQIINEVTSARREQLAQEGGYYPAELHCTWTPNATQSASSPNAENNVTILAKGAVKLAPAPARSAPAPSPAKAGGSFTAASMKALMRSETLPGIGSMKEISQHRSFSLLEQKAKVTHSHSEPRAHAVAPPAIARHVQLLQPQPAKPISFMEEWDRVRVTERRGAQRLPGLPRRDKTRLQHIARNSDHFDASTRPFSF